MVTHLMTWDKQNHCMLFEKHAEGKYILFICNWTWDRERRKGILKDHFIQEAEVAPALPEERRNEGWIKIEAAHFDRYYNQALELSRPTAVAAG